VESITKNRQPADVLRAMVERAYGASQVPVEGSGWASELGFGMFNAAYRIRLRDGEKVVLKIAPSPGVEVLTYERGAMATEVAALRLIRENTGLPVPVVDYADSSRELCDADYFFMPFVDGENLAVIGKDLTAGDREAYQEALGSANRELNSLRGAAFGPLTGPGDPSWRTVFTKMAEDVLRDGERRQVDIGWDYDTMRDIFAGHAASLDEVTEPAFVEWDLWDGNVLVRSGKIAGIIDHERAFYGDPLIEFGFIATQLPAFGDPAAFLRGYGRGPLTETEQVRRRLYCLHLMLIMVIETAYREFTEPAHYDWVRARLNETMALFSHQPR
jgi:aminoglycoside phosphotransferase (APT) family kinase protein